MNINTTIAAAALLLPFVQANAMENSEPLSADNCATELEVNLLYSDEKEYQASVQDPCIVLGRVSSEQIVKTLSNTGGGR